MYTIHLTLKKEWFDMIAAGRKKEEYREVKNYWLKRLTKVMAYPDETFIIFKNGYSKNAPEMGIIMSSIKIDYGKKEWGAQEDQKYFVLSLGEIVYVLL